MAKKRTRPAGSPVSYERLRQYREQGYDVGPKYKPDLDRIALLSAVKQAIQQERERGAGRSEWQLRSDRADALRKEMELRKQLGQLVEAEEVKATAVRIAQQIREAVLNIPDRIAARVAAEPDARRVHAIVLTEVRQTLEALAEGRAGDCQ
jgi:phage terminase Nu1 subunit (DNA packaging protein)